MSIINSFGSSRMVFTLDPMRELMAALGQPQNSFPAIHVAGTNGKGSVCAMLAAVYAKAGVRVGLYTSPHLETVHERFQVNGKQITEGELAALALSVKKAADKKGVLSRRLTQFEFLTAIAFLWFQKKKVDLALIEVGMGGRLDATNVMDNKVLSIITTINYDHVQWLGNTLSQIAFEKSGIIKPSVPVITGARGEPYRVISRKARANGASLISVQAKKGETIPPLSLKGSYQIQNARLVMAAVRQLRSRFPVNKSDLKWGLAHTRWPGRFELIRMRTPGGIKTVILDGAHNPEATRQLVNALDKEKIRQVNLLFGVLRDKDARSMVSLLAPQSHFVCVVPLSGERAAKASVIAGLKEWGRPAEKAESVLGGFKKIIKIPDNLPVLITGSLYLVGSLRKHILKGAVS